MNDTQKHEEQQLLDTIQRILEQGYESLDRTGVGTKSIFGVMMTFNLRDNTFPLMTTRKLPFQKIVKELLFYTSGKTNAVDEKIDVWYPNTTREFLDQRGLTHYRVGDMGPSYSFQFRHQGAQYNGCDADYTGQGTDQLLNLIQGIKTKPYDRRHIINLWIPNDIDKMSLPPCLFCFQFNVQGEYLSCMATQRSSDICLAGGWNIATISLLCYMVAHVCRLKPDKIIWCVGNCHIYLNQLEAAREQLTRTPNEFPKLIITKQVDDILSFDKRSFQLQYYKPYSNVKYSFNV